MEVRKKKRKTLTHERRAKNSAQGHIMKFCGGGGVTTNLNPPSADGGERTTTGVWTKSRKSHHCDNL